MNESTLTSFLNKYTKRYRDYELVDMILNGNYGIPPDVDRMKEDCPVCFDTASFVSKYLSNEKIKDVNIKSTKQVFNILPYLKHKYYLDCEFDARQQSHGFGIIPMGNNKNYIVQSMDGLLAAHYEVLTDNELINRLIRFVLGDMNTLTHTIDLNVKTPYDHQIDTHNGIQMIDMINNTVKSDIDYPIVDQWSLIIYVKDLKDKPIPLPILKSYEDILKEIRDVNIREYDTYGFLLDNRYETQQESFIKIENPLPPLPYTSLKYNKVEHNKHCNMLVSGLDDWAKEISSKIDIGGNVYQYTKHGDELVNKGLRFKKMSNYSTELYNSLIDKFDDVPPLPKTIITYRGIHDYNNTYDNIDIGNEINNVGFISTTFKDLSAFIFAADPEPLIFNITIPIGSKVLFFDLHYESSNYAECEILLSVNPIFKVTKKYTRWEESPLYKNKGKQIKYLDVIVTGYNTPTKYEIQNMYDKKDDDIYNIIKNISDNVFMLDTYDINKIIVSYIYDDIYINKTEIYKRILDLSKIYATNISNELFYKILYKQKKGRQYINEHGDKIKDVDVWTLRERMKKREIKTLIYENKEYPVIYISVDF